MDLDQEKIYEMAPFARTLGVRFVELARSAVQVELTNEVALSTLGGGLHGGAVMSLSDVAAAVCVGLHVEEGSSWSTVESSTSFLRSVTGEKATATARPVKPGRRLFHVEVDVVDDGNRHCARTAQVYLIRT